MNSLKQIVQTFIALSLCVFCHGALAADDGKITAEERAKVIKLLKESQAETLAALEKLSDEQLKFKSAPEKWSVLEVGEHILLAESRIFGAVGAALAAKPNPDWEAKTKGKTELLEDVLGGRKGKAQAPESIVPSGKLTREEIITKFKEARAKTLKFAEETDKPLKMHTYDNPFPVFGTLNAYQWLIYVPLHNIRHNKQIAEVMANPNFPKK
ncbi:MAG TPA: DinB family protein [Blastocatellia bacterium]|nr:DinB family protein [Blastocatellia bacterium]HMV87238.1 DinB family protein [Blastocatellia bacterium]HMX25871.1 DinB family protein [Blastocatellia bacterium]HMY74398.1 DinB family protein [Blastocatellia bacterium]HMZ21654.1 DinB family protein [Blastocatellia bacterium]